MTDVFVVPNDSFDYNGGSSSSNSSKLTNLLWFILLLGAAWWLWSWLTSRRVSISRDDTCQRVINPVTSYSGMNVGDGWWKPSRMWSNNTNNNGVVGGGPGISSSCKQEIRRELSNPACQQCLLPALWGSTTTTPLMSTAIPTKNYMNPADTNSGGPFPSQIPAYFKSS